MENCQYASAGPDSPENGKSVIIFSLAKEKTLQEAAAAINKMDSIKVLETENTKVNGLPAMTVLADQGTNLRFLTYLIDYGNNIYKFYGVSSRQDYSSYASIFLNTMENFKKLTDPAKLNVKPDRVRIRTVKEHIRYDKPEIIQCKRRHAGDHGVTEQLKVE